MSLTAWRTFLEVCRLGSLSAAAGELGFSQSAISRQISALERQVGASLLERQPRGVRPTAAGEAFRHHARLVVNESDRAVRAAREVGAGTARLAIGATPSTSAGIVPVALRELVRRHGRVAWTLGAGLTAELEGRVVSGDLDLAVVTDAPPGLAPDPHLTRHPLGTDEMRVLVPQDHPLARSRRRVALAALQDELWVEDNEGSAALLRGAAVHAGFEPRLDLAAADLPGKAAMVAAGHAVALVPGVLVPALRPDVTAVRVTDPPTRGIFASVAAAPATSGVHLDDLVACLRRALRSLA